MNLSPDAKEAVAAGAKITAAWGSVGAARAAEIASLAQAVASVFAAVLTFLLILQFLWKNVVRPICEWQGWMKRKRRRHDDADSDAAPLGPS